jgi:flavin-dependent dehydrogenase
LIRRPGPDVDLVIAGAGPAGLATAIHASIRGLRPLVLEARPDLLDKACGEGIMPGGVEALQGIGVRFEASECRPFAGIRYVDGELAAEGRFPEGRGLGVRRLVLVRRLLERARELGAEVRFGSAVQSWDASADQVVVRTRAGETTVARVLVGADGLHSRVRRRAGLEIEISERAPAAHRAPYGAPRRFGLRRHFACPPWSDLVEVHLGGGVEAYVTPVAPDVVGVALLFESGRETGFDELLDRFPDVRRRLGDAPPLDAPRGAGPLRQRVRGRVDGPVALVGDAAGYCDALTGQGLELGFLSAGALVDVLRSGAPLEHYETAYRRITRDYYRMTDLLVRLTRHRSLGRGLVRLLARVPGAFDRALQAF